MAETTTPIPLRTLTTLLNYERCIADGRFRGCKLLNSTFADPNLIDHILPEMRQRILGSKPASVEQVHLHVFLTEFDEVTNSGTNTPSSPSAIDTISPDAFPNVKNMSFAQRELIYHESRGHDGCYKAIELYQQFFELCSPEQKLSVQIKKESPVLVSPFARRILEFNIAVNGPLGTITTGSDNQSLHSALGFAGPGSRNVDFVVDMTRMQWGEAGRGRFGELYYLGSIAGYYDIMDNVCEGIVELEKGATHIAESPHTEAMKACARRVWERWENRDKEGWCDYCGVGASERSLSICSGCQQTKVRYCCKEHQASAWKLHKFTCEKKKK